MKALIPFKILLFTFSLFSVPLWAMDDEDSKEEQIEETKNEPAEDECNAEEGFNEIEPSELGLVNLPNEILIDIFQRLPVQDLANLRLVNSQLNRLIQDECLLGVLPECPEDMLSQVGFPSEILSYGIIENFIQLLKLAFKKATEINLRLNDQRYDYGNRPLHVAAENGRVEAILALLAGGANIEGVNNNGETPLHVAARWGRVEAILALLARGATIEAVDSYSNRPLHFAAANGRVEAIRTLLARGANIEAVNGGGRTPLFSAAANGRVEAIRALLEWEANIEASNNQGYTPLHIAAANGRVEAIRELLGRGANIEAVDRCSNTPLHVAARRGSVEAIRALLEGGANIEAINNYGDTPLQGANIEGVNNYRYASLMQGALVLIVLSTLYSTFFS